MSETPNGTTIKAFPPGAYPGDAEVKDITEEVQVMYDIVVSCLDWGSGFLDKEEVDAVKRVAEICGFEIPRGRHYDL